MSSYLASQRLLTLTTTQAKELMVKPGDLMEFIQGEDSEIYLKKSNTDQGSKLSRSLQVYIPVHILHNFVFQVSTETIKVINITGQVGKLGIAQKASPSNRRTIGRKRKLVLDLPEQDEAEPSWKVEGTMDARFLGEQLSKLVEALEENPSLLLNVSVTVQTIGQSRDFRYLMAAGDDHDTYKEKDRKPTQYRLYYRNEGSLAHKDFTVDEGTIHAAIEAAKSNWPDLEIVTVGPTPVKP